MNRTAFLIDGFNLGALVPSGYSRAPSPGLASGNQWRPWLPKISEFFGISIYVYFEDHAPPHFHAVYAEHEAQIKIADSSVLRGTLPPRVMRLVVEWAGIRRAELDVVWREARDMKTLSWIQPLE